MAADDLLNLILSKMELAEFVLTKHAKERMSERSVSIDDIVSVAETCFAAKIQEGDSVKVKGYDVDGEELTVVAAYSSGVVIITVY